MKPHHLGGLDFAKKISRKEGDDHPLGPGMAFRIAARASHLGAGGMVFLWVLRKFRVIWVFPKIMGKPPNHPF